MGKEFAGTTYLCGGGARVAVCLAHGCDMLASYQSLCCAKSIMGEPGRRKSYSEDLRWRIVYQRHLMGLKYREISQNLTVSVSTVARVVDRFERTGEVTRRVKPATERILHEHDVFVLMQIVLERPSTGYSERLHRLQECLSLRLQSVG